MPSAAQIVTVHAPSPPLGLSVVFVVLVAWLVGCVLWWVHGPAGLRGSTLRIAVVLLGWLGISALAAASGLLGNFDTIPPRVVWVILPALIACLVIGFQPRTAPVLDRASGYWLIAFQAFRIVMEIILWQLARAGVIPVSMTFEGRNYDILVGFTAPFIAWLAFTRGWVSPGPVIFWNVFGIVVLANVVVIGFLSAPTRFQQFFEGPPNEMVGHFPFVWLVSFVVPLAFLGHLLSGNWVIGARRGPGSSPRHRPTRWHTRVGHVRVHMIVRGPTPLEGVAR
jgi:hypothetical protein